MEDNMVVKDTAKKNDTGRQIFFWVAVALALFHLAGAFIAGGGYLGIIILWAIALFVIKQFAFDGKYAWWLAVATVLLVMIFSIFVLPSENDNENIDSQETTKSSEKVDTEVIENSDLSILQQIKKESDINFGEIEDHDSTEFIGDVEDLQVNTYVGKWMIADNKTQTKLIEDQVHGFFEKEGFTLISEGGVGGSQSMGGRKYERGLIFCTTFYGVGTEVTSMTLTCASRDNPKTK